MLVCAGEIENIRHAKPIGIGLVNTAINLTRLLVESKGATKRIIFIGSAGSYDANIKIFSVFASNHAFQLEQGIFENKSYSPADCEVISEATPLLLDTVKVNSSNFISTDLVHAQRMQKQGILLENMEFFSVLKVAKSFGITSFGVFCISNFCSKDAHKDFLKNHKKVLEILNEQSEILRAFDED